MGEKIKEYQPRVIGVEFHAQVSYNHSLDVVEYIKKNFPEIPVIAGGQQSTFRPEPVIRDVGADVVVLGEGEYVMIDLVKHYLGHSDAKPLKSISSLMYLENGEIITTDRSPRLIDLDAIPLPDRDAFNWKKYPQWVIMTSRGCPYKCAFCSSQTFWGQAVRFRSAENVLAEMQQLVDKYKVTSFLILDDTFTLKKERLRAICEGIVAKKLPITWACGTRTDQIDEETLQLLKMAGCNSITFGLESANEATLKLIKKGLTVEQQRRGVQLSKQAGFQTRVSVMLGLPGESVKEVRNTLDFLLETEPNEIQIYPIMPYDGTELHSKMDVLGISIDNDNCSDWSKDSLDPIAGTKDLSNEEIVLMAKEMVTRLTEEKGYTHMTGKESVGKLKLDKVVSTGLSPFQKVESYACEDLN
jgi:radical SAM superfamily enzyme YgiQ (UPF0313 family)